LAFAGLAATTVFICTIGINKYDGFLGHDEWQVVEGEEGAEAPIAAYKRMRALIRHYDVRSGGPEARSRNKAGWHDQP